MKFELMLENVKVEYPRLYTEDARGSVSVLLHLEKHVEEIAAISNVVKMTKAQHKTLRRSATCLVRPSRTSWCPADHRLLSCVAPADNQIVVIDRDMTLMSPDNCRIKAGSVCNVKVEITTDEVNIYATVIAIQFVHVGRSYINRTEHDKYYRHYKMIEVSEMALVGFKPVGNWYGL